MYTDERKPFGGTVIEIPQYGDRERQMIEVEKAIRRLKKKLEKENLIKILRERQYYRKPSEIKREKKKIAQRLYEKRKKKQEFRESMYENTKYVPRRRENENGAGNGRREHTASPAATTVYRA